MSDDLAISVRGLSKSYTISHSGLKRPTFRDVVMDRLRHPLRRQELETFWAIKDVSFDIKQGEVVGIIGRNGAGKSTLLKILSRITDPTAGHVELFGRVGSLLEVGTGFHPELTGRENIYLNGAILGMSRREIDRQFDAIVDFAEVEKFLDTPVKRYSSGMYVRLAFAVAAHLEPEILIVDEVLAVGDIEFQQKCLGKMQDVSNSGRTVIFVSHNMGAIAQHCGRAILMERGRLVADGHPEEIITEYTRRSANVGAFDPNHVHRTGTRKALFTDVALLDDRGNACGTFTMGRGMIVRFTIEAPTALNMQLALTVSDSHGRVLIHAVDRDDEFVAEFVDGRCTIEVTIPNIQFYPGRYTAGLWCGYETEAYDYIREAIAFEIVQGHVSGRSTQMVGGTAVFFAPTQWTSAAEAPGKSAETVEARA